MSAEFEYLQKMANEGGPKENQFEELNSVFQSINKKRKEGAISECEIEKIWHDMPDVFYSLNTTQGFAALKPYGYSGDFEVIERIYDFWKSPKEQLVNWDIFFHAQAASCAVRNRRKYFLNLLHALHSAQTPKSVLNIASGPAREVVEFLSGTESAVFFECVDNDRNAIEYSSQKAENVKDHVQFHYANAFYFNSENTFDLVWSAGLFDYLDERTFKILLKKLFRFVNAGGELVVGNFSPDNPSRDYMEFGNWQLNHRSADELINLAVDCGISNEKISVHSEPLGINLFLHIRK